MAKRYTVKKRVNLFGAWHKPGAPVPNPEAIPTLGALVALGFLEEIEIPGEPAALPDVQGGVDAAAGDSVGSVPAAPADAAVDEQAAPADGVTVSTGRKARKRGGKG